MLLLSGSALAQQANQNEESEKQEEKSAAGERRFNLVRGVNEWGVWGAVSIESKTPLGHTIYRTTWLAGLRYGRIVGVKLKTAFEYTFDLVPMELVLNDPIVDLPPEFNPPSRDVYGFGIWPGGIKFIIGNGRRWRPFLGINGGLTYFTKNVPFHGRRANISGNLDAGVHILVGDNRMLTIAYKYHHVSNAYTAERNVGTNVNMVMIGYSFLK